MSRFHQAKNRGLHHPVLLDVFGDSTNSTKTSFVGTSGFEVFFSVATQMSRPATARLDSKEIGQNRIGGQNRCQKDLWFLMISDDFWFLITLIKVQKPVLTSFRVSLKPHPAKIGDLSPSRRFRMGRRGGQNLCKLSSGNQTWQWTFNRLISFIDIYSGISHSNLHSSWIFPWFARKTPGVMTWHTGPSDR